MELIDERSSAKVFYPTLAREPEKVQSDTKLGPTADQEIVDVILSGRVSFASASLPLPLPSLPFLALPFLTRPFPFRPNITSSPPGSSRVAYGSPTAS